MWADYNELNQLKLSLQCLFYDISFIKFNLQETCKAIDDQDAERISNLERMKKDYEEKIHSIEDAMNSGTEEQVTPEEINKLRNELFRMKNFGPNLRLVIIKTNN